METFFHRDFSQGWCPSDSPINTRPGGLLLMDCVDLDTNGDLTMTEGANIIGTAYSANAHTLYSKFISSFTTRYVTLTDGATYRNNTSIKTGGSTTRTAFGSAFDYVLFFSGTKRCRDDGTTTVDLGQVKASVAPILAGGGGGILSGLYEYVQVNVFNSGAYVAKSAVSAISSFTAAAQQIQVTAQNPTAPSNEVWIFRRGVNLEQFYRVKRILSSYNTPFNDNKTDSDVITEGITLNLNALSINSTDLPDDILGVEGPINGRMLLCTKNTVYFTEVNSIESYVPGQGIMYSSNSTAGTEVFLWIKKLSNNTIAIGTTKDIYFLQGTFITLPDGTLDVYLRSTATKHPPIDIFVDVYENALVYMGSDGWRFQPFDGPPILLSDPRIDRIYSGVTMAKDFSYNKGVPIYIYPAVGPGSVLPKYTLAISRGKLFCRVPTLTNNDITQTWGSQIHIYDFKRRYWRTITQNIPDLLYAQEDGSLLSFYNSDKKIREFNYPFARTVDGGNQTVDVIFPIWNFNSPRNRKDLYTLKLKINTGNVALTVKYAQDESTTFTTLTTITANGLLEKFLDLSALPVSKSIQLRLTGAIPDFQLSDISIDYDLRPTQVTFVKFNRLELGDIDGHKNRIRAIPLIIDTLGSNVTFTPTIEGVDQATSTFNTNRKTVVFHYFSTDVNILDLGVKLSSANLFELYKILQPEIVQTFPTGVKFTQFGPFDIFRYGRLRRLRVHLHSDFTGNIPYIVYFQDSSTATGNISVVAAKADAYEISLPKGNEGEILRVELGPTANLFYKFSAQAQFARQGTSTDLEWQEI